MLQETNSQFAGLGGGEGGSKAPEQVDTKADNIEANDSKIVLEGDTGEVESESGDVPAKEEGTTPAFSDFMNRNLDKEEIADKEKAAKETLIDVNKAKEKSLVPSTDTKAPPATSTKPSAKDYTGIEDSLKPVFSKMSTESFNYSKKLYLENKELKEKVAKTKQPGELPDSYYEHEQGYTLDRQYQVQQIRNEVASNIEEHYANQIANIEAGEQWTKVVKINNDGSLTLSEPQDPSSEAKKYIVKEHIAAQRQSRNEEQKMDEYVSKFKNKHSENLNAIKSIKDTFFKGYDDEKHPAQALRKEIIAGLPSAYQNHPLADIIAYAAYNNAVLLAEVKAVRAGKGTVKSVNGVQQSPTNKNFTGTTTSNGPRMPTFSDFKARLDR